MGNDWQLTDDFIDERYTMVLKTVDDPNWKIRQNVGFKFGFYYCRKMFDEKCDVQSDCGLVISQLNWRFTV